MPDDHCISYEEEDNNTIAHSLWRSVYVLMVGVYRRSLVDESVSRLKTCGSHIAGVFLPGWVWAKNDLKIGQFKGRPHYGFHLGSAAIVCGISTVGDWHNTKSYNILKKIARGFDPEAGPSCTLL